MIKTRREAKGLFAILIIAFLLSLARLVFADDKTISPPNPSWFEHIDLMQVLIVVLLGYVAFTVRRFIKKVDNTHSFLTKVVKVLIQIGTEHRGNHECSSVNLDELLKAEGEE